MEPIPTWNEDDSRRFLDRGRFYVPDREEQIATVCAAIPVPACPAHLVDLCCGEGLLSAALLESFPSCTVHGYDGSSLMLEGARATAGSHAERFHTHLFDLFDGGWRGALPRPLHAVVSSLAIHHLDGPGKLALFRDLHAALAPGGALVVADLVAPPAPEGVAIAARAWDEAVRRRSLDLAGDLSAFERFEEDGWNLYADPEPDPVDKPSPLYDQLRWLDEAGFTAIDVYWMKAGHAIFGGRKAE